MRDFASHVRPAIWRTGRVVDRFTAAASSEPPRVFMHTFVLIRITNPFNLVREQLSPPAFSRRFARARARASARGRVGSFDVSPFPLSLSSARAVGRARALAPSFPTVARWPPRASSYIPREIKFKRRAGTARVEIAVARLSFSRANSFLVGLYINLRKRSKIA